MYYLNHILQKIRYNNLLRLVLDGLTKVGIQIWPFYFVQEGLLHGNLLQYEKGFDSYEIGFLGASDMKTISSVPFQKYSKEELLGKLKEGEKCFGVKKKGDLVAFTWFNLHECTFEGYRFTLKDDEAFFSYAHTLLPFRGKRIAPYMRYQSYKELAKMGRTKLYSVSGVLNAQSVKFKKKLYARFLELCLFIKLLNKWHHTLRIKKYNPEMKDYFVEHDRKR